MSWLPEALRWWTADRAEAAGTWAAAAAAGAAFWAQVRGLKQERKTRREEIERLEEDAVKQQYSVAGGMILESPQFTSGEPEFEPDEVDDEAGEVDLNVELDEVITSVSIILRNVSDVVFHSIFVYVRLDPLFGGGYHDKRPDLRKQNSQKTVSSVLVQGERLQVTVDVSLWELRMQQMQFSKAFTYLSTNDFFMQQFEWVVYYTDPSGHKWRRFFVMRGPFAYSTKVERAWTEDIGQPFGEHKLGRWVPLD